MWQHVLKRHKVLNDDQLKQCLDQFKASGGQLPVEQILLDEGWAGQKDIETLRRAARVTMWGQLLLQNKLLTKEQWHKCIELYNEHGGRGSIGGILVDREMLDEKRVQAARQRVAQILGAPKLTVPSQSKPAGEAPPADDDIEEADDLDEVEEIEAPAASAGADDEDDDGDDYEFEGEEDETPGKANEMDWVDTVNRETKPHEFDEAAIHADQIDLADIEGEAQIIVNESKAMAQDPNKLYQPKSNQPATTSMMPDTDVGEGQRIQSPVEPGDLDEEALAYLKKAVQLGASDLHLAAGSRPFMRLNGELKFFERDALTPDEALRMALGFMTDKEQQKYLGTHDVDFSYELEGLSRFRVNALLTFRGADIIFRIIPSDVPTLKSLGIPEELGKLTDWTQGLVLVTGPAGCGKSTTAAALVDLVNENRRDHVITVEDPVEYIHPSKQCNVTQRQVPRDTESFATALRAALREDPDVIMIGEMRDLETISLALTAAETGHLVIGTLHTKSAARTVDRIIDVFPTDQQTQIRIMISEALRGIISQVLVPRADGKGRVAALEILYNNLAVANAIRDAKTFQVPSIMQTGKKLGMVLMDDSLAEMVKAGTISREDALKFAENTKHIPG